MCLHDTVQNKMDKQQQSRPFNQQRHVCTGQQKYSKSLHRIVSWKKYFQGIPGGELLLPPRHRPLSDLGRTAFLSLHSTFRCFLKWKERKDLCILFCFSNKKYFHVWRVCFSCYTFSCCLISWIAFLFVHTYLTQNEQHTGNRQAAGLTLNCFSGVCRGRSFSALDARLLTR